MLGSATTRRKMTVPATGLFVRWSELEGAPAQAEQERRDDERREWRGAVGEAALAARDSKGYLRTMATGVRAPELLLVCAITACSTTTRYRVTSEAGRACAARCDDVLNEDGDATSQVILDCLASCEGIAIEEAECPANTAYGGREVERTSVGTRVTRAVVIGVVVVVGIAVLLVAASAAPRPAP